MSRSLPAPTSAANHWRRPSGRKDGTSQLGPRAQPNKSWRFPVGSTRIKSMGSPVKEENFFAVPASPIPMMRRFMLALFRSGKIETKNSAYSADSKSPSWGMTTTSALHPLLKKFFPRNASSTAKQDDPRLGLTTEVFERTSKGLDVDMERPEGSPLRCEADEVHAWEDWEANRTPRKYEMQKAMFDGLWHEKMLTRESDVTRWLFTISQ